MQYDYSNLFTDDWRVEGYVHKFGKKIDVVRHKVECRVIRRYATGDLYDCSVGHGRFISELTRVSTYSAMDYSEAFIRYVEAHYPQVVVKKGDLLDKIDEPDNRYDTVLCIRTLIGLGEPALIIGEMVRIARPGGRIIFDYLWQSDTSTADPADCSVEKILQDNSAAIIKAVRIDSPFVMNVKRRIEPFRSIFKHKYNILPASAFVPLERIWGALSGERVLYVAQKRVPTAR